MLKKNIKIFSMVLAILLLSLFAGCSNAKDSSVSSNTESKTDSNAGSISGTTVDPEDYRGTSVTYVTWKDPYKNEDGIVVDKFKEKYGIDVKIDLIDEAQYISIIAGSIAAGTQGDVIFVNGTFPGSLTVMQPLDAAQLDLSDPIWDQFAIQSSSIDGHPYLVNTVSNVWSEVDICVYNKNLFESNGITTPAEYYEQGKWTIDAFKKACQDIKALGKDYLGAAVLGDAFLGGCGVGVFGYENGEFKVTVNDKFYDCMSFLAELATEGLINPGRGNFADGRTGMAITNCFALKKTGYFSTMNPDHIGATYLPKYDENSDYQISGIYRGWGLIRGSKNPVAAGIFLREYLDVNNYDLDNTFHSDELANFFFQVTNDITSGKNFYYTDGLINATGIGEKFEQKYEGSPSDVITYIESQLNVMNNMASKGNEIIASEKKWLSDNYGSAS